MRRCLALCLLAAALVAGKSEVKVLTDKTFDKFIESNERVLVEFYAPWCGHCKALAPEYEAAAKQLKEDGSKTILAKVDATKHESLGEKYAEQGFPTLKLFTGSTKNPQEFGQGRNKNDIVDWVQKRERPALSELKTKEEVEKFKGSGRMVIIAYCKPDSELAKTIKKVSDSERDRAAFGVVMDEAVAKAAGVTTLPKIVLHKKFDDPMVEFDGKDGFKPSQLKKFLKENQFALIDEIGPENYEAYMERGLPLAWVALSNKKKKQKKELLEMFRGMAKKYAGKVSFTWVDGDEYGDHLEQLGIVKVPGLMITEKNDVVKYRLEEDLDQDSVEAFMEQYANGKAKRFMKSQEPPKKNDGPVKVLVGKTFEETAMDKKKNVMVEFYAPWCGHCKALKPEYKKVAEHFADEDDSVVIAMLDATENDTPEEIEGFPTLVFYRKDDNLKLNYYGENKAKNLIKWITKAVAGEITESDPAPDYSNEEMPPGQEQEMPQDYDDEGQDGGDDDGDDAGDDAGSDKADL